MSTFRKASRGLQRPLSLLTFLWSSALAFAAPPDLTIRAVVPLVAQARDSAPLAFLTYNGDSSDCSATIQLSGTDAAVTPASFSVTLRPRRWQALAARVSLRESADRGELLCRAGQSTVRIAVIRGMDLTTLPWKRLSNAERSGTGSCPGTAAPPPSPPASAPAPPGPGGVDPGAAGGASANC